MIVKTIRFLGFNFLSYFPKYTNNNQTKPDYVGIDEEYLCWSKAEINPELSLVYVYEGIKHRKAILHLLLHLKPMRLWYRKNNVVFLKKANSSKINLSSDEIILSKVSNFVIVLLMIRATKKL